MKSDNVIQNGTSIFMGIIVAIAAFVRGALLLPLLLIACSVWGRNCQRLGGLDCPDSCCGSCMELLKASFGGRRAIYCAGNSGLYRAACLCHGSSTRNKQHFQKLVPDVRRAAPAVGYERMVPKAVRQYGR